ncbi:MAG: mechanosensitive ion channel [Lachnospiraceae bacterium]|nr:mechanosensitive ion channel [Lachnospiraceae bacterium]
MKPKKLTGRVITLIGCLAVAGIALLAGILSGAIDFSEVEIHFNAGALLRTIVMAASVIAVVEVLSLLLAIPKPESHRMRSVLSILTSLLKYVAFIVILCWGLSIFGVNVSTIVASVGIIALVVGFSAESLIADVVTGAFMLFENQYNVGDIVEVNGFRGTVINIGIRTTSLADPGDNVKIVNNSDMRNILNRSDRVSRSISEIAIPYATDLEKLEEEIPVLMDKIYEKRKGVFKAAPVYMGVQELAESSVILKFIVNVDERDIYAGARLLNRDLLLGFRSLGVECPFPQIDVHQDRK